MNLNRRHQFDLQDRCMVLTGGAGVLCGEIACALAECGADIAILDRVPENARRLEDRILKSGVSLQLIECDVLDRESIEAAFAQILEKTGRIDGLVNGAGGNHPDATTSPEKEFFDLPAEALRFVFDLNIVGTILPSQTAARQMAAAGQGVILNISSMNAFRPLTRIPAYSAAKAGVSNFTQWLAVHLAREYSPRIRVNAIAPGFFLTDQNRFLLTEKDTGNLTPRGQSILDHTPLGRFGNPEDLVGAALWLLSPLSEFVTGIIIPIDGGFQAYSGV